jgi:putative membrane protein
MALSDTDKTALEAAIRTAEAATSGEIRCICAQAVGDYRIVALAWAAIAALVAVPLLLLTPVDFAALAAFGGWRAAHIDPRAALIGFIIVQTFTFLFVALGLWFARPLRFALTPRWLKRERVHRTALEQFLARGLHLTTARTGVLILLAREERHAEIVADEGIHREVGETVWAEIVSRMLAKLRTGDEAGALALAIAECGALLAQHFPPGPNNPDELPNALIEM